MHEGHLFVTSVVMRLSQAYPFLRNFVLFWEIWFPFRDSLCEAVDRRLTLLELNAKTWKMEISLENSHLPSGYGEDFMSSIDDDLLCLICQLPLREPVLTRCGHRFCRQCLEKHLARFAPVYLYFIVTHQCKLRSIHRLKNFDKIYIFYINVLAMSQSWHLQESIISLKGKPWMTNISHSIKLVVLLISACYSKNAPIRVAHSWNIFQDSKRNFLSPPGHIISSISLQLR